MEQWLQNNGETMPLLAMMDDHQSTLTVHLPNNWTTDSRNNSYMSLVWMVTSPMGHWSKLPVTAKTAMRRPAAGHRTAVSAVTGTLASSRLTFYCQ